MLSLSLLLWLVPLAQAAPNVLTSKKAPVAELLFFLGPRFLGPWAEVEAGHDLQPNPFQSGPEQFRLLQNYLTGLKQVSGDVEHMKREQVLLYLFALHDFDQSGQLDGLELLAMLAAALFPGADAPSSTSQVIHIVDRVLETQDLDRDGMVTPAELLKLPGDALGQKEPQDSSVPFPQNSELVGRPALLATDPLEQDTREVMIQKEDIGSEGEDRRKNIDSGQEARSLGEALGGPDIGGEDNMKATDPEQEARSLGEATGPGGEESMKATDPEQEATGGPRSKVEFQSEAGEEITGPEGEFGEGIEVIVAEGTLELGESLEPKELLGEFESNAVQLGNDEM